MAFSSTSSAEGGEAGEGGDGAVADRGLPMEEAESVGDAGWAREPLGRAGKARGSAIDGTGADGGGGGEGPLAATALHEGGGRPRCWAMSASGRGLGGRVDGGGVNGTQVVRYWGQWKEVWPVSVQILQVCAEGGVLQVSRWEGE